MVADLRRRRRADKSCVARRNSAIQRQRSVRPTLPTSRYRTTTLQHHASAPRGRELATPELVGTTPVTGTSRLRAGSSDERSTGRAAPARPAGRGFWDAASVPSSRRHRSQWPGAGGIQASQPFAPSGRCYLLQGRRSYWAKLAFAQRDVQPQPVFRCGPTSIYQPRPRFCDAGAPWRLCQHPVAIEPIRLRYIVLLRWHRLAAAALSAHVEFA